MVEWFGGNKNNSEWFLLARRRLVWLIWETGRICVVVLSGSPKSIQGPRLRSKWKYTILLLFNVQGIVLANQTDRDCTGNTSSWSLQVFAQGTQGIAWAFLGTRPWLHCMEVRHNVLCKSFRCRRNHSGFPGNQTVIAAESLLSWYQENLLAKGRIGQPNRMNFRKSSKRGEGGSFSIQNIHILQILRALNRAFWAWNWYIRVISGFRVYFSTIALILTDII